MDLVGDRCSCPGGRHVAGTKTGPVKTEEEPCQKYLEGNKLGDRSNGGSTERGIRSEFQVSSPGVIANNFKSQSSHISFQNLGNSLNYAFAQLLSCRLL